MTRRRGSLGAVRSALALSAALAVLAAVNGCRDPKLAGKACQLDEDCGSPVSAFRCEPETGVCYCRTDAACPGSQFCNTVGFCQDRSGCEKNADCLDPSLFCDTSTGTCLSFGRCSSDLQCELGQVCDNTRALCVEGCRKNGDCGGSSCRCGGAACACTGTTPEEIARCDIGVCDPTFCADNTFCRYGETCGVPADAGVTADGGQQLPTCYTDYDSRTRPYCDNCTFGGGLSVCGSGPNYCLIDTRNAGNYFCGADCGMGQTCPRGYACQDVIVVLSQWSCTRTNPACPINLNLPCTDDTACKRGGRCAIQPGQTSGYCAPSCSIDEGDENGFCSCQLDEDCAQETCSAGECSISRRPCVDDVDCRSIKCVDFQGAGGCLIGQNCAPANGLSCIEVR